MGNTTRQGMKFGLILLLLLAGVVFRDPHVAFPRRREAPLYGHAATPRPVRFQERPRRERGFAAFGRGGAPRRRDDAPACPAGARCGPGRPARSAEPAVPPAPRWCSLRTPKGEPPARRRSPRQPRRPAPAALHGRAGRDAGQRRQARAGHHSGTGCRRDGRAPAFLGKPGETGRQDGREPPAKQNRANPGEEIPSGGEGVPFLRLSCHERGRARLCRRRSGRRGLPARR